MGRHAALGIDTRSRYGIERLQLTNLRTFGLYQAGTLCVVLTTVLVWPLLGRILSQSQLGELSLHLAVASISAPALALGSHLYLANKLASARNGDSGVEARTALSLTPGLYLLAVIALCSCFLVGDADVLLSLALSCATAAYLVTAGVTRGINRPSIFAACAVAVQVLGLVGLGLAAAATDDLRNGVLVYVITIGVPVALQFILLREQSGNVPWKLVMRTLSASSKLVPHLVLAVALLTTMRVLVALQLGNEAAANYTFASLIIGGSITVGASLDAHWSVRAQAATSIELLSSELTRNQNKTQMLLLITTGGVVFFLYVGLPIWLPEGYDSRGVILAVLCALPAASLQAVADGRAAVLMWKDRPGLVSGSTAAGTSVTIALAYLLVPEFGWSVIGAVLTAGLSARVLATIVSARVICPASRLGVDSIIMLIIQFVFAAAALTVVAFT